MRGSLGSGDKIQRSQIPTEANENGRKKNKLASMRSKVTRMDGIMGPTGAGLDKAEDILPSNSDMVGAWQKVRKQCPWYFLWKSLKPTKNPVDESAINALSRPDTTLLDRSKLLEDVG